MQFQQQRFQDSLTERLTEDERARFLNNNHQSILHLEVGKVLQTNPTLKNVGEKRAHSLKDLYNIIFWYNLLSTYKKDAEETTIDFTRLTYKDVKNIQLNLKDLDLPNGEIAESEISIELGYILSKEIDDISDETTILELLSNELDDNTFQEQYKEYKNEEEYHTELAELCHLLGNPSYSLPVSYKDLVRKNFGNLDNCEDNEENASDGVIDERKARRKDYILLKHKLKEGKTEEDLCELLMPINTASLQNLLQVNQEQITSTVKDLEKNHNKIDFELAKKMISDLYIPELFKELRKGKQNNPQVITKIIKIMNRLYSTNIHTELSIVDQIKKIRPLFSDFSDDFIISIILESLCGRKFIDEVFPDKEVCTQSRKNFLLSKLKNVCKRFSVDMTPVFGDSQSIIKLAKSGFINNVDEKLTKKQNCLQQNKGNIIIFSVAAGIAAGVAASVFFGKNPDLLLGSVAKNLSLIIGVTTALVLLISGAYKLAKHCEPKSYLLDIREGETEQPLRRAALC